MYGKLPYTHYIDNARGDIMATTAAKRQERIELRVTSEVKELIEYAATLRGETITAFATRALAREAEESINDHQAVRLSAEDSMAFARALFADSEPNENLKKAARRYQSWKNGQ